MVNYNSIYISYLLSYIYYYTLYFIFPSVAIAQPSFDLYQYKVNSSIDLAQGE